MLQGPQVLIEVHRPELDAIETLYHCVGDEWMATWNEQPLVEDAMARFRNALAAALASVHEALRETDLTLSIALPASTWEVVAATLRRHKHAVLDKHNLIEFAWRIELAIKGHERARRRQRIEAAWNPPPPEGIAARGPPAPVLEALTPRAVAVAVGVEEYDRFDAGRVLLEQGALEARVSKAALGARLMFQLDLLVMERSLQGGGRQRPLFEEAVLAVATDVCEQADETASGIVFDAVAELSKALEAIGQPWMAYQVRGVLDGTTRDWHKAAWDEWDEDPVDRWGPTQAPRRLRIEALERDWPRLREKGRIERGTQLLLYPFFVQDMEPRPFLEPWHADVSTLLRRLAGSTARHRRLLRAVEARSIPLAAECVHRPYLCDYWEEIVHNVFWREDA